MRHTKPHKFLDRVWTSSPGEGKRPRITLEPHVSLPARHVARGNGQRGHHEICRCPERGRQVLLRCEDSSKLVFGERGGFALRNCRVANSLHVSPPCSVEQDQPPVGTGTLLYTVRMAVSGIGSEVTLTGLPLPLRFRPARPMSDGELIRFSERNRPLPIERDCNGDIVVMSPSGSQTGNLNAALTYHLTRWTYESGLGYSFDSNTGFTLPDGSMRSPDASWIPNTIWEAVPQDQRTNYAPICPPFVIELRSPSDSLSELHSKMQHVWIANGAELAWLVDPLEQAVTIYRPGHAPQTRAAIPEVRGEGPVAGFTLPLDRIFMQP